MELNLNQYEDLLLIFQRMFLESNRNGSLRKGEMVSMDSKGIKNVSKFIIPSRGIIGLRIFITATAGRSNYES